MFMKNPFARSSKTADREAKALQADLVHSRLGVLYVFSQTYANPGLSQILIGGGSSLIGGGLQGAGALASSTAIGWSGTGVKTGGFCLNEVVKMLAPGVHPKPDAKGAPEANSLWNALWAFFKGVPERIGKLYQGLKVNPWAWGAGLKVVISAVISAIIDTAVPLGGVFDVVRGVTQAAVAGFNRIMSWLETRTVALIPGHTAAIVEAVQKAMELSMGEGLWVAAKGGAQIGLDLSVPGIGTLAKAIASGLETVVKYCMRLSECMLVENFRKDAHRAWQTRETARYHEDGVRFGAWFRRYALAVPAIGAVALNCGYCGSPLQYLNMYTSGGQVISQRQFDAGMGMLTRLKSFSKDYLNATNALGFGSPDPTVHAALEAARFYGGTPKIHGDARNLRQNSASTVVKGLLTG